MLYAVSSQNDINNKIFEHKVRVFVYILEEAITTLNLFSQSMKLFKGCDSNFEVNNFKSCCKWSG